MQPHNKVTRRWLTLGLLVSAPFAVLVACSSSSSNSNAGNTDAGPTASGTATACAACKVNADCVAGFACSGSVCTKQCNVDMDCAGVGPGACDDGVCGCEGHTTAICGACISTADCTPGARCLLGTCKPDTTQSTCSATNACKAPLVCDPNLGCICSPEGGVDAGQGAGNGTVTVLCTAGTADGGVMLGTCSGTATFDAGFPIGTGFSVTTTQLSAAITEYAYSGMVAVAPTTLSAGEIDVAGPSSTLIMSPDSKNVYAATSGLPLGNAGDKLTVSAAGAAIPMFTAMVALPPIATLTSPVQPVAGGALVVDHTMPLTIIASAPADGKIVVVLTSAKSASSFIVLRGEGQITGGSGGLTIPSSALSLLPAGAGGTIQMFMASDVDASAGGTPIKIEAATRLYDGNGDPVFANTPLTMQ